MKALRWANFDPYYSVLTEKRRGSNLKHDFMI